MQRFILSLSLLSATAVTVLGADLKIDVTLPVECERQTKPGDKISVHYRGTLQSNGQKFDASYDRGTPLSFSLGGGQVIKGWDKGLMDMCIGEKRTLTVPPEYGYGQRSMGPIPAGSTLVFETELMGIDGVPKPETIVTKSATESSSASSEEAETSSLGVAAKLARKVADAVDGAKTVVADTGDDVEHNEL